ncbi:hypothetical protein PIB30_075725 [Stylosanthes scabra]|uniref:Ribonuclease H1 N-terminal domain-containing protein n=1 Tax=Stylosanthes scabra TaxID=79078 RepID=A0ABU6YML6_9FABA|nr:hypothetical protein [Stylosanthes scabra]
MVECYVVFAGRNPGVYASWPAAARQMIGFSGAVHQRYPTMEAGFEAWNAYLGVPDAGADNHGNNVGEAGNEGAAPAGNEIGFAVDEPVGEAVNREAQVARASFTVHSRVSTETEVDGPAGDGVELPCVMGAIDALEGRVSQLEVDK